MTVKTYTSNVYLFSKDDATIEKLKLTGQSLQARCLIHVEITDSQVGEYAPGEVFLVGGFNGSYLTDLNVLKFPSDKSQRVKESSNIANFFKDFLGLGSDNDDDTLEKIQIERSSQI